MCSRLADIFGSPLGPRALFAFSTLADLEAALFGGEVAARRGALRGTTGAVDWDGEVAAGLRELREGVRADRAEFVCGVGTSSDLECIFLTGATGFLGARVLQSIAACTAPPFARRGGGVGSLGLPIVCLVRAADDGAALVRLRGCLLRFGIPWAGALARRTVAVAGDLATPRLGLTLDGYWRLARRARVVVHCGALVSSALPYAALKAPNVGGTCRVLQLALLAARQAPATGSVDVCFVSTLGFVPAGQAEVAPVSTRAAGLSARSGYAQSKWVAESITAGVARRHVSCPRSQRHGRPCLRSVRVFRPGTVCGDSESGMSNPNDAVSMLVCGLIRERMCCVGPESPLPQAFNLCPVNYVSEAIVRIMTDGRDGCDGSGGGDGGGASGGGGDASEGASGDGESSGDSDAEAEAGAGALGTYHLCSPQPTSLAQLCEWARAAGHELGAVSPAVLQQRLRAVRDEAHPLFALKPMLLGGPRGGSGGPAGVAATAVQMPRAENTRRALGAGAGAAEVPAPIITQAGFARSLSCLLATRTTATAT